MGVVRGQLFMAFFSSRVMQSFLEVDRSILSQIEHVSTWCIVSAGNLSTKGYSASISARMK